MSGYFPMELTREILSRLPVKSLCRFKTVSKKLCYLIEDPDFIKYQLHRSRQSGKNQLILVGKLRGSPANPIHSADVNSIYHGGGIEKIATTRLVDCLIGCCDGLACLYSRKCKKITMINISTRETYTINYNYKPANKQGTCEFPLGFGYDSLTDDYKVVFIEWIDVPGSDLSNHYKVKIYSLKTCKWTTIAPTIKTYYIYCRENLEKGVFMAASLHSFAVAMDIKENLITAFNLETLTFHEVNMPYKLSQFSLSDLKSSELPSLWRDNELSVLGGLLCMSHFDYDRCCTDIWVMEEYKVKESWSKRFSVPMQVPIQELVPLAYSESGDKILLESEFDKYLYWFDHVKEQVSKIDTIKRRSMLAQVSTPSLVRLRQRKQNVYPKKRHLKLSDRQSYKKTKQWGLTKCETSGTHAQI